MAEQYQKPYLDSSVFIAWIKGEIITTEEEEKEGGKTIRIVKTVNRKMIVDHLLKQAQNGDFKIHISSFTLAEVHKKRNHEKLTNDEDEKILAFFENDFIVLIDVDRTNGEEANRICRDLGLLPGDATHLACALRAGCDVLLAWDDRITNASHPRIRIEEPEIVGDLDLFAQAVTIERIEKVPDVKTTKKD